MRNYVQLSNDDTFWCEIRGIAYINVYKTFTNTTNRIRNSNLSNNDKWEEFILKCEETQKQFEIYNAIIGFQIVIVL